MSSRTSNEISAPRGIRTPDNPVPKTGALSAELWVPGLLPRELYHDCQPHFSRFRQDGRDSWERVLPAISTILDMLSCSRKLTQRGRLSERAIEGCGQGNQALRDK